MKRAATAAVDNSEYQTLIARTNSEENTFDSSFEEPCPSISHVSYASSSYPSFQSPQQRRAATRAEMLRLIYRGLGRNDTESDREIDVDVTSEHIETFDNMNCFAESPNCESPQLKTEQLEEFDLDILASDNVNTYSGSLSLTKQVALIIAASFRATVLLNFVFGYVQYGGAAYFLAFVPAMFFVAAPIAVMELAIAQYTALMPIKLFTRLSVASTGIGIVIVIYRLVVNFSEVVDGRPIHSLINLLAYNSAAWAEECELLHDPLCYAIVPGATARDTHIFSLFDLALQRRNNAHATATRFNLTGGFEYWRTFSHSESLALPLTQVAANVISHKHTRHFLAVLIIIWLSALLCYQGLNTLAKTAMVTTTVIVVLMVGMQVYSLAFYPNELRKILWYDPVHLMYFQTYLHALCLSLQMLSVGNGAWLILGTVSPYKGNIIMPVVLTASLLTILSIGSTIGALYGLPAAMNLYEILLKNLPLYERKDIPDELRRVIFSDWHDILFYRLQMISSRWFCTISHIVLSVMQIPYTVLTLEMLVQISYRIAPMLLRLRSDVIRICVINTLASSFLVYAVMETNVRYRYDLNSKGKVEFQLLVVLMEVCTLAHIYRDSRVIMNIRAMVYHSRFFTSRSNRIYAYILTLLRYNWHYLCPCTIFIFFFYRLILGGVAGNLLLTVNYKSCLLVTLLSNQLVFISILVIRRKFSNLPTWTLFTPHVRWGPANVTERRKAIKYERAANILG